METSTLFIPYVLDEIEDAPSWNTVKNQVQKCLDEVQKNDFRHLAKSFRDIHKHFAKNLAMQAFFCVVADLVEQSREPEISENGLLLHTALKAPKEIVRDQLLARRNASLKSPKHKKFLKNFIETRPGFQHVRTLFHDGTELFNAISEVNSKKTKLADIINPEIVFFDRKQTCEITGKRYQDIWKYCRLTWTLEHQSIPGRELPYLIRNAAHPNKPIIGIGCLASPVLQHRLRDDDIGWTLEGIQRALIKGERTPSELFKTLQKVLKIALHDLKIDDFDISDDELKNPSSITLRTLDRISDRAELNRKESILSGETSEVASKDKRLQDLEYHKHQSQINLFVKKRADKLKRLLECRIFLNSLKSIKNEYLLRMAFFETKQAKSIVGYLIGEIRTLGVSSRIAELNVCGAIPPYNHIMGGKLVALSAFSNELQKEYKKRYSKQASEIASAMAGRIIYKPSSLEMVTTTSLYGSRSSQYNRLHLRKIDFPELPFDLRWEAKGLTEGEGTFHFSNETSAVLNEYAASKSFKHVNNKFGEGTGAKLRKLRSAISDLGLDNSKIMNHGQQRLFLVAALTPNAIENLWDFKKKRISQKVDFEIISNAWLQRWVEARIQKTDLIQHMKEECFEKTLASLLFEEPDELLFGAPQIDQADLT